MNNTNFHSEKEVTKLLKIDDIALNMLCLELEKRDYTFLKDERNQFRFYDKDIVLLRRFFTLAKEVGMTLQTAADRLLLTNEVVPTEKQDENNESAPYHKLDIQVFLKHIQHIQKFNQALLQQMDEQQKLLREQQSYIENALRKIQQESIDLETIITKEEKKPKKGFWYHFFS
ncbi:hypothetical protein CQZ94_30185 [Bacillus sp. MYb209]|uniref:hypothetical protein n=1 Tax=Bacillus sp. MYb209 TaxID=1848605 RepID=UPI000CFD43A3|nr:hypothetical protein [Bacillus sp. MYb209]PQZ44709.1 hypothetical protein CQZ94_30185 [Bacillus sp. MYb209]